MNWRVTDLGVECDGWVVGPRPSDDAIAAAYLSMKGDGSIGLVSHQSDPTIQWWLNWLTDPKGIVLGAYSRPDPDVDQTELVGMGFVNDIVAYSSFTKAEVGFAFFGPHQPNIFKKVELIRAMVDVVFTKTPIDSLLGLTPERNPGAAVLIKRAGLRQYGPIPQYCSWHGEGCGAFISQTDKATWMNLRPHLK